jgi:uncharacterized OsmC-like protein
MLEFRVPQKRIPMRSDLTVRAVHRGEMRVDVHVREHLLEVDYPAVTGVRPTPLEVLLASLAACATATLSLVAIELVYILRAESLAAETVDRAVRAAEVQLCPVLAMLRPGTEIRSSWRME